MTPPVPALAVVIPALNERDHLERLLPARHDELAGLAVLTEIVVVAGGSTDGTQAAADRHHAFDVRDRQDIGFWK